MVYLTSTGLFAAGIIIIMVIFWIEREDKSQENVEKSGPMFALAVFFEILSVLLGAGAGLILLPLGLIFLGIVIFIYH